MKVKKIDPDTMQVETHDLSPYGMFDLGWRLAKEFGEAEVAIDCNYTIKRREGNIRFDIKPLKGKGMPTSPVVIIAKRSPPMTTNQPTDATQELLSCEHCSSIRSGALAVCGCRQSLLAKVESLTAQLAAAKAEAKAWEAYASNLRMAVNTGKEWPNIPQPVDASSLARIARVALDGGSYIKATNAEKQPGPNKFVEEDRFEDLHKSVDALTPDDIALAQAQVGGV